MNETPNHSNLGEWHGDSGGPVDTGIVCSQCMGTNWEHVTFQGKFGPVNDERNILLDVGMKPRAWCPVCGIAYDVFWVREQMRDMEHS